MGLKLKCSIRSRKPAFFLLAAAVAAAMFALCPAAYAYEARPGGFRDAFDLGAGARSMGMGSAFSAIADDATATYWNPAGLAQLTQKQTASMRSFLDLDRKFDFGAIAFPLGHSTIGGHIMRFGLDNIPATELNTSQIVGVRPDGTPIYDIAVLNTYSDSVISMGVSLATSLWDNMSLGGTIKYLRDSVYKQTGSGFGADLGFLFTPTPRVKVGLNLRNFPAKLEWDGNLAPVTDLSATAMLGVSYQPNESMLFAADMKKTEDVDFRFSVGGEYSYSRKAFFRLGYDHDHITAGLGVRHGGWQVDYAFADRPLAAEHRLSSTFRFGSERKPNHREMHIPVSKAPRMAKGSSDAEASTGKDDSSVAPDAGVPDSDGGEVIDRKDRTIDSLFVGGSGRPAEKIVITGESRLASRPDPAPPERDSFESFERLVDESEVARSAFAENRGKVDGAKGEIKEMFRKASDEYGEIQDSDFYFDSRNLLIDKFDPRAEKHVPSIAFEERREPPKLLFTFGKSAGKAYVNGRVIEDYRLVLSENGEALIPARIMAEKYDVFYVFSQENQLITIITPSRAIIKSHIFSNIVDVDGTYRKIASPCTLMGGRVLVPMQVFADLIRRNY